MAEDKQPRSGLMLLLFALLPLTCIGIAIAVPMLSAFSGLQKIRAMSDKSPVSYEYERSFKNYANAISNIKKFLSTKEPTELELSIDNLNNIINYHPSFEKIRGSIKFTKIFKDVSLHWVSLQANISLPLDNLLHEPGYHLNKQVDFGLAVNHSTLLRDKEVLFRITNIYDKGEPLNLEIINIWGEKNLIDLWISDNFSEDKFSEIKEVFDKTIEEISYRQKKIVFKNYVTTLK